MRRPQPQLCQPAPSQRVPTPSGAGGAEGLPGHPTRLGLFLPNLAKFPQPGHAAVLAWALLVVLKPNWDADRESTAARMPLWPCGEATQPCGTASTLRVLWQGSEGDAGGLHAAIGDGDKAGLGTGHRLCCGAGDYPQGSWGCPGQAKPGSRALRSPHLRVRLPPASGPHRAWGARGHRGVQHLQGLTVLNLPAAMLRDASCTPLRPPWCGQLPAMSLMAPACWTARGLQGSRAGCPAQCSALQICGYRVGALA